MNTKYTPKLKMYSPISGNTEIVKIAKKDFKKQPLEVGSVILVFNIYEKHKKTKDKDGKWIDIPNEYEYWIDDYEEGEYITFPQNPQKEGYTFDGWYKDAGCQTEWNEAVDCYDKPEDVNTVNLYAKWIENES